MSFISFICFTIVFVIDGSAEDSNSVCDSLSMANLTIDSTVLIAETNEIYFFTNWIATKVNLTNGEFVSQNITEAFDFKDKLKDFKPPVDWADIGYSGREWVLELVANSIEWHISVNSHDLVDTKPRYEIRALPLDVIRMDMRTTYELFADNHMIRLIKYDTKTNAHTNFTLQKFDDRNVTQIQVIAVDNLNIFNGSAKFVNELNGHDITSGVVIPQDMKTSLFGSGKLVLFANQFFIEVSQSVNDMTPFVVKTNEWICSAIQSDQNPSNTPTFGYITLGTDKNNTPDPSSKTNIFAIIVLVLILVLVLIIGTAIVIALNSRKNNKRLILRPTTKPDIGGNQEPNEELSGREMSGVFDAKSTADYSKPIPVMPSSPTLSEETSLVDKPTDLKVN